MSGINLLFERQFCMFNFSISPTLIYPVFMCALYDIQSDVSYMTQITRYNRPYELKILFFSSKYPSPRNKPKRYGSIGSGLVLSNSIGSTIGICHFESPFLTL